jgi:hypothetical protein
LKTIIDNTIKNLQTIKNNIDDTKTYPTQLKYKLLDLSELVTALVIVFNENTLTEENQITERKIFLC